MRRRAHGSQIRERERPDLGAGRVGGVTESEREGRGLGKIRGAGTAQVHADPLSERRAETD